MRQAPGSAGFADGIIAPRFTGKLERLAGRFRSVHGDYTLAWQRESDGVLYEIEIPQGCRATLMPLCPDCRPVALGGGFTKLKLAN